MHMCQQEFLSSWVQIKSSPTVKCDRFMLMTMVVIMLALVMIMFSLVMMIMMMMVVMVIMTRGQ